MLAASTVSRFAKVAASSVQVSVFVRQKRTAPSAQALVSNSDHSPPCGEERADSVSKLGQPVTVCLWPQEEAGVLGTLTSVRLFSCLRYARTGIHNLDMLPVCTHQHAPADDRSAHCV